MTFGEKLKQLRTSAGMTLAALAAGAEIGLPTLKDYEGNRRTPSLQNAQRLAQVLGVDCTAFNGLDFQHAKQRVEAVTPPAASGRPKKAPPNAVDKPVKGKKGKAK